MPSKNAAGSLGGAIVRRVPAPALGGAVEAVFVVGFAGLTARMALRSGVLFFSSVPDASRLREIFSLWGG
jgi:hypothetical protein